jgi:hypothetical protein
VNVAALIHLLNYLAAGVLWAFAGAVGCMIVLPV